MLENVKKALLAHNDAMTKAAAEKTNALNALNKSFEVKGKRGFYVPESTKGTEAYSNQYSAIMAKYENAVKESTETNKTKAREELAKVRAAMIVKAQEPPTDEMLNSIKALELIGAVDREAVLLQMENNKNYLACQALAKIAETAGDPIPVTTFADIAESIDMAEKEIDNYFTFYNPLGYKTAAFVSGSRTVFDIVDDLLNDFEAGYFTRRHNPILETISNMKKAPAAKDAAKAERAAMIEAKAAQESEAEKSYFSELMN